MTRPPEKPVPVSEREAFDLALWAGITPEALLTLDTETKRRSYADKCWSTFDEGTRERMVRIGEALARARHEGRLEERERCARMFDWWDAGDLTPKGAAAAIRALALPEGDAHE